MSDVATAEQILALDSKGQLQAFERLSARADAIELELAANPHYSAYRAINIDAAGGISARVEAYQALPGNVRTLLRTRDDCNDLLNRLPYYLYANSPYESVRTAMASRIDSSLRFYLSSFGYEQSVTFLHDFLYMQNSQPGAAVIPTDLKFRDPAPLAEDSSDNDAYDCNLMDMIDVMGLFGESDANGVQTLTERGVAVLAMLNDTRGPCMAARIQARLDTGKPAGHTPLPC